MLTGALVIAVPLAVALFTQLFRVVLDKREARNFRAMSGWLFWSLVPCAGIALIWSATGDASDMAPHLWLGSMGAVLGAAGLVWIGYALKGPVASKPAATAAAPFTTHIEQNVTSH